MKTRNLLLALGCAAALTACTENDEPNVAPAPATKVVTLSVDVIWCASIWSFSMLLRV